MASGSVKTAILPVGGLGSRFLPATKAMPKEMLTVVDKPLVQYAVDEARAAGIENFIFVTGRGKAAIEDHFDHSFELEHTLADRGKNSTVENMRSIMPEPGQIAYVRQQDPLGLGHAIWCARHMLRDEAFAVLLPDIIIDPVAGGDGCLKQLVDAHDDFGGIVLAVEEVPRERVSSYGIIDPGKTTGNRLEIRGMVEKPSADEAPSNLCITGRYILSTEIFDFLDKGVRGAGGEIQLTDAIADNLGKMPIHGVRFSGRRFDCGSKEGFVAANLHFGLKHPEIAEKVKLTATEIMQQQG